LAIRHAIHPLLQETITDSESENERKPPSLKRKVKPNAKADDGKVQAPVA
jgi:hypothetical protein